MVKNARLADSDDEMQEASRSRGGLRARSKSEGKQLSSNEWMAEAAQDIARDIPVSHTEQALADCPEIYKPQLQDFLQAVLADIAAAPATSTIK